MMLGIEDILCELADHEEHGFPPGFRFHPTDEELITFYLASKVFHGSHTFFPLDIAEVDLNKCEPWDLPDVAKMGKREWFFYSLRDRKYPTGLRTNRATATGYWKATGKDKEIHCAATTASAATGALIGMKKTLVFYLGRAPRGQKTKWVMHEYRLHGHYSARASAAKEEWVICRICRKTVEKTNMIVNETGSPFNSQLTEQFLKNQATVFPIEQCSNEDSHRTPLMCSDTLQANFGPFVSSFQYQQPASTFYPTTDIVVNPTASFSSMLIRSLITNEDQNSDLIQSTKNFAAELVKTEPNFSYMLSEAHELEWVHKFHHSNPDGERCTSSYIGNAALDVELRGGGGIQNIMDPNFRIQNGESWAVDA